MQRSLYHTLIQASLFKNFCFYPCILCSVSSGLTGKSAE